MVIFLSDPTVCLAIDFADRFFMNFFLTLPLNDVSILVVSSSPSSATLVLREGRFPSADYLQGKCQPLRGEETDAKPQDG